MLSGRGLCDELITRPGESYRLCCVVVCDLEISRMGAPYIYDISSLRVKAFEAETAHSAPRDVVRSDTLTLYAFVSVVNNHICSNINRKNELEETLMILWSPDISVLSTD